MSTQLIAHLKKKCETDDNVKILLSQWEFDQKLVGKALENIGGFYPHFSNHNASHSQQILVNIERILGKDIELLSTTDTWLILESAYWHDVGMLVDAKSAKEVHGNDDFKFMVKTIAQDKGHDLHTFCLAYEQNGWVGAIGSQDHPFDGVEKYRQLIAEWFRRNHDKRIGGLVEDPFKFLNITSPRTELLPKRIYRYLGQICMSHGMNFTDLMEKLPFKQTGLGTEDCHPRFIGCLLRLGDLFDLDDNRFCPVMAKHLSHQPRLSKAHEDKHLSLREFQLDERTVKLVAECPDEMSYVETQNWFGWIREEFQNQMSQWNLIVPNLNFGSLPTIEQLDVKMEVKYENGVRKEKILLHNKPMKFTIDEKNGIEILQGANLYKNKFSIFRELIQNSIDSTMLRVWLENKDELIGLNPYHPKYLKIIKNYQVVIDLGKVKDIENSLDSVWELSIRDKGIGISQNDLFYMQKMAGSDKNLEKKKIINDMPLWMRPSGKFGIGLHSAFLLLDNTLEDADKKIKFKTCSYFNNENLEVEMFSPLGGKQGFCFINKIQDNLKHEYGAEFLIRIKRKFSLSYQGVNRKNNPIRWSKEFVDNNWKNNMVEGIYKNIVLNSPINPKKNIENILWDEERCVAFKFDVLNSNDFLGFRGQNTNFRSKNYNKLLCGIYIDYYNLDPSKVLNVSRDTWSVKFTKKLEEDMFYYMSEYVKKIKNENTSLLKKLYSNKLSIDFKDDGKWRDFVFKFGEENRSINDLNEIDEFYIVFNNGYSDNKYSADFINCLNKNKFFVAEERVASQIKLLIEEFSNELFPEHNALKMVGSQFLSFMCFYFSKDKPKPISKNLNKKIYWGEIIKESIESDINYSIEMCFETMQAVTNSHLKSNYYGSNAWYSYFIGVSVIRDVKIVADYKILCIKDGGQEVIINPYQISNNRIELTNLEDLSTLLISYLGLDLDMYEKILHNYKNLQLKIEKELKKYLE